MKASWPPVWNLMILDSQLLLLPGTDSSHSAHAEHTADAVMRGWSSPTSIRYPLSPACVCVLILILKMGDEAVPETPLCSQGLITPHRNCELISTSENITALWKSISSIVYPPRVGGEAPKQNGVGLQYHCSKNSQGLKETWQHVSFPELSAKHTWPVRLLKGNLT